jgi:hypothetical protein
MKTIVAILLAVVVVCFGGVILVAASSPAPAYTLAFMASSLRCLVWMGLLGPLHQCAAWAGAWRWAYGGPTHSIANPPRLGRWLGLVCAAVAERLGREMAYATFQPGAAREVLARAANFRRSLELLSRADAPELALIRQGVDGIRVVHAFEPAEVQALTGVAEDVEQQAIAALETAEAREERSRHAHNVAFWGEVRAGLQKANEAEAASGSGEPVITMSREDFERLTRGEPLEDGPEANVTLSAEAYFQLREKAAIRVGVVGALSSIAQSPELSATIRARLGRCIADLETPEPEARLAAHPLFPGSDEPEERDIVWITFERRTADGTVEHLPEDIPRAEVTSWGQVIEWWGGGGYRAIGKDAGHRVAAVYPLGLNEWVHIDGDSLPFTRRPGDTAETEAPR